MAVHRDEADVAATIASVLGIPGPREPIAYPGGLPAELARWHCYTPRTGHAILVAVAALLTSEAADPTYALVPAPVRAVLRAGWRRSDRHDLIVSDLPYDADLGVLVDPADRQP